MTAPHEMDERYAPKTNAALRALNGVLIEAGQRLTVGQHSTIMRRFEKTLDIALDEPVAPKRGHVDTHAECSYALCVADIIRHKIESGNAPTIVDLQQWWNLLLGHHELRPGVPEPPAASPSSGDADSWPSDTSDEDRASKYLTYIRYKGDHPNGFRHLVAQFEAVRCDAIEACAKEVDAQADWEHRPGALENFEYGAVKRAANRVRKLSGRRMGPAKEKS